MSRKLLVLCCIIALSFGGCATINQGWQDDGPAVYGGLRYGGAVFSSEYTGPGDMVMVMLDWPTTLVLDTILLPFSAINEIVRGGIPVDVPVPPRKKKKAVLSMRRVY